MSRELTKSRLPTGIEKLISGGQTGADRAALDAAIRHGLPRGGWCPKGHKAEDGTIAPQYNLTETPSGDYHQRTEWNVRDSDGTAVFTLSPRITGGSFSTMEFAVRYGKPCLHISRAGEPHPAAALKLFVRENGIKTLNVAGSRESKEPGIHDWVMSVTEAALEV